MNTTIWARSKTLALNVAPHIRSGFSYGFDDAVPERTRKLLCDFMAWIEENFKLPITLWVYFEYKHYLVSSKGKRVGYLFYWNDIEDWSMFDDEDAIPMIRLPVRDERWTANEILASFIEAITDYFSWLNQTKLSASKMEHTIEIILGAYQNSGRNMQIIDYFQCDNQPHWLAAIADNEWRAAKYLAQKLENGEFHDEFGQGTVCLLTEGDRLISFLTLTERDCIDAPEYAPWIGFVHTAPEYRGHRHIGKLIDHACAVAHEHGAARVYLATDHVGLYEKYGFTYLENRVDHDGEDSRVYVRELVGIEPLTSANFRIDSLDGFIRRQEVTECWRCIDGEWQLLPFAFTDDWDTGRRREKAAEMRRAIESGIPAFGAFDGDRLVGFALLGERLGSRRQYFELDSFHVSAPHRGQGIGRRLFAAVCDAARASSAEKLYISAHSSKESQAAYRALGCVHAAEVDPVRAAKEPCDVQMEYIL